MKGIIAFGLILCHICVCLFWAAYLKWPYGDVRNDSRFEHPPPFTEYEKKVLNGKAGIFDFLGEMISDAIKFMVNIKFVGASAILFVLLILFGVFKD